MSPTLMIIALDADGSSASVLATIAFLGLATYGLYYFGALGWVVDRLGRGIRWAIRKGFRAWEATLSWAHWAVYLLVALGLLGVGALTAGTAPMITLVAASAAIYMGVSACLAYMYIDLERYEVERGYKAVHNPLKGQELASDLARYGQQVDVYLLVASTVAMIGGFALLNQGLYESIGAGWYGIPEGGVGYADFLTYALLNLLRVVDILDLARSQELMAVSLVRPGMWPATTLIVIFRSFFTLVLLQQIFASIRQGRLLAETITDFWSPHEPIQQRARNALPQYGAAAIGPLLISLRSVTALTKEQRDQLPQILAAIGPSTIPTLVRHLHDPHEHVRAVSAAALGYLNTRDVLATLVTLARDPSDLVRQSLAEALGLILEASKRTDRAPPRTARSRRLFWRSAAAPVTAETGRLSVLTLRELLGDAKASVRWQAALSLGRAGEAASEAVPDLTLRLRDADETVRCQAAETLGEVGGPRAEAVRALMPPLEDPSAAVRAAAARGLAKLGRAAGPAVPSLVPLLQDRDEAVRAAAAEAISLAGPLDEDATASLVDGLTSPDNVVRAQAAEALGAIGAPAEDAADALADGLRDSNDVVRAKSAEALGKIGEAAAEVAVPHLVKALRDRDSWVSALAAEALGEMGDAADGAVSALVKAMSHVNAQVRANAASALGKLGDGAERARPVLEKAVSDEDGGVRAEAIRAIGLLVRTTPGSLRLILDTLCDPDPQVRAAGIEALSASDVPADEVESLLLPLLRDATDEVKVQAIKVLARLVGARPPVVEGLCDLLATDDSSWVQVNAALGLAQLGSAAAVAGPALLRAAQTGDANVREQAMKALARVQPAEAREAFTVGLKDPSPDVRLIASAGWMNAEDIPEDAVGALVDALKDPEVQVRANAAHALSRLDKLPPEAVPLLLTCAADPSDILRLNAALALRQAAPAATTEMMEHLLEDTNVRVRVVAAGALLAANPEHATARAVVTAAQLDPSPRVRQAAADLWQTLRSPSPSEPPAAPATGEVLPLVPGFI